MDLTRLPAAWLRDNCGCSLCRDPRNGQKLFHITDLPQELAIGDVRERAGGASFEVEWVPDGHRSVYALEWLTESAPSGDGRSGDGRTEDGKQLWRAAALDGRLPEADWEAYLAEPAERIRVLESVQRLGFALLRGVPCRERQVLAVAETFGYVRETNYGSLFDVRVEADPNNLAFTGAAITPHTDNPYRDPVPTLQLLHCLTNAATGGDSGLVDGFAAAALLRDEDPAAYEVLTRTLVPFRFDDARSALRADRPLIDVDPLGRIREVRFNNRSIGTLRLSAEELDLFYAAYRRFGALLLRDDLRLDFRLAPGDCLIFDNTRLLHARTAFAESGERHLQGCYADLDGLASTLEVLRREQPLDELAALFEGAGAEQYLGEEITQAQHMLQAAALAEAAGAGASLVAAALLHDVGHFHGPVSGADLMASDGTDNRHSHTGAERLARWFGPEVTEPVRLHVAAKRYLCAVEPDYFGKLSEASVHTLRVQGGPMSSAEVRAFEDEDFGADAVRLRRWDEAAKRVDARTPDFAHFRPLLAGLLR
ncbi:TauD/TfdA family dioxygenase [Streptomyces sp. H10-C2]|uniref:2-trimethylaminoethylphosphonate dioxygenase n=1 Tax=unclassified Streptomyces TaxID=2593676 RepID=UPI0024B8BBC7|nr:MULTISPECIES: TauD/TfdA family dioxygenase [unclassified Streptomyces]MDJ0343676.1 TauD/TfdA family dioxygenase [Streptomyces sp. PH10-H1]MDJ0372397.1 TauD/TfdA family dioxygenase [Streptomyces sp. H10-C2]